MGIREIKGQKGWDAGGRADHWGFVFSKLFSVPCPPEGSRPGGRDTSGGQMRNGNKGRGDQEEKSPVAWGMAGAVLGASADLGFL